MALAMRKSSGCAKRPTQDRPSLNLYDIPEMMAGAQPSANSVDRERFNQRCRKLWEEDDEHVSEAPKVLQHSSAADRFSQLENAFPDLDPELIWNMCHETANVQQIVDTLLALSASMSSDTSGPSPDAKMLVDLQSEQQPSKTVQERVPQNGSAWPALLSSDGWEIVNYQALEDQDLGSAWSKTAKDAAPLPAPRPSRGTAVQTKQKQKESKSARDANDDIEEDCLPTDYELRHARGHMRATKLATKSVARGGNRACNNAPQEREHLASESGDSVDMVSEASLLDIQPAKC
jgi:hypothetical protein